MLSENQLSASLIFSVASLFSVLFVSFNVYYFSPSANFGFVFFLVLKLYSQIADLRLF